MRNAENVKSWRAERLFIRKKNCETFRILDTSIVAGQTVVKQVADEWVGKLGTVGGVAVWW